MIYNAKESTINALGMKFEYISLGSGDKPLIMIQGLIDKAAKTKGYSAFRDTGKSLSHL